MEVLGRMKAINEIQRNRFERMHLVRNANLHPAQIRKYCTLEKACQALITTVLHQLQLNEGVYRCLL